MLAGRATEQKTREKSPTHLFLKKIISVISVPERAAAVPLPAALTPTGGSDDDISKIYYK
jgi:hypothetical protein